MLQTIKETASVISNKTKFNPITRFILFVMKLKPGKFLDSLIIIAFIFVQ